MKRLQYSVYDEKKRCKILKKALKKIEKKKDVSSNRQSRSSRKIGIWYLQGGKMNQHHVKLKKMIERIARKYNMKWK